LFTQKLFSHLTLGLLLLFPTLSNSVEAQDASTLKIIAPKTLVDSGIVDALINRFKQQNPNVEIELISTGALKVIEQAYLGQVDLILSHYPMGETFFINEGHAARHAEIMYNYFTLLGPQSNNLDLVKIKTFKDLLLQMSQNKNYFLLPHPRSGTFQQLQSLATHYNVQLDWPQVSNTQSNVNVTILQADEMEGYTFADMGSYLKIRPSLQSDMVSIYRDDVNMQNHIQAMVVSQKVYPQANAALANQFFSFLIDDNTQEYIANFGLDEYGIQLFTPVAHLDPSVIAERSLMILDLQENRTYYQAVSIILLVVTLFTFIIIFLLKKSNLKQRQQSEERFSNSLDSSHEGIWDFRYKDKSGYVSERCHTLLELPISKKQSSLEWLASALEDAYWQDFEKIVADHTKNKDTDPFVLEFRIKKDEKERLFRLRARLNFSNEGQLEYIVGAISDTNKTDSQQVLLDHFIHLATHDNLTKLPNRMLFKERLDELLEMAEGHHAPFSLLFIDLNDFKNVNDRLGHHFGDELLIEVAFQLKRCLRPTDMVARFGGDEFVILLPKTSKIETLALTADISHAIQNVSINEQSKLISASIGITYSDSTDSKTMNSETLLKQADKAMYYSKQHQLDFFEYHSTSL
jgi:diguanylate cyclase (GGDEF)-like protein